MSPVQLEDSLSHMVLTPPVQLEGVSRLRMATSMETLAPSVQLEEVILANLSCMVTAIMETITPPVQLVAVTQASLPCMAVTALEAQADLECRPTNPTVMVVLERLVVEGVPQQPLALAADQDHSCKPMCHQVATTWILFT